MKKIIRTILVASLIPLSYFPAYYASTVELRGMAFWASMITMVMLLSGIFGTVASILED